MSLMSAQGNDEVMAEINITPFTDVLLVLLIIFIILAAVTKEPKLPDAKNELKVQPSQIVVIVDEKNRVQIGSKTVTEHQAAGAFKDLVQSTGGRLHTVII